MIGFIITSLVIALLFLGFISKNTTFTAKEAKRNTKNKTEIKRIISEIKKGSKMGLSNYYCHSLSEKDKTELIRRGFTIIETPLSATSAGTFRFNISW